MSDLRDLYQEMILDHGKKPRNQGRVPDASHEADGHNHLCGDQLHLTFQVQDGKVVDAKFDGQGCAISTASASLLTETVRGKTLAEIQTLADLFVAMVKGEGQTDTAQMGKLAVFAGVSEYPVRVKCASLPWRTAEAALGQDPHPVSTE